MANETVAQATAEAIECESVSGTCAAILKATGIDIRELPQVMDGSGSAVVVKDGHRWTINPWEGGGGFAVAARPQTEEETERSRQQILRSTLPAHFSKDKLLMCVDIAKHVVNLSTQMPPDHPSAMDVLRKLDSLATIQLELLCNRNADVTLLEQELRHVHA